MLDPAVAGEMLAEFLLRLPHRDPVLAEHNGAGTGGALVDCENESGHNQT
jgi:hypothetical protein